MGEPACQRVALARQAGCQWSVVSESVFNLKFLVSDEDISCCRKNQKRSGASDGSGINKNNKNIVCHN
jgi:hypothetical protein